MTERTCTIDGCGKPHRARGLCSTHYNRIQPARHRKTMVKCDWCGSLVEKYASRTVTKRFCSARCREQWADDLRAGSPRPPKPPRMTAKRKAREARETRRSIVDHMNAKRYADALAAIFRVCTVTDAGCWLWPTVKDGYGVINGRAAHRVAMSAHLGAPLDDQPVHHKCANRGCANPDHLQLVTHYDNAAEMMARTYLLRRIVRLEHALREIDPTHPAL